MLGDGGGCGGHGGVAGSGGEDGGSGGSCGGDGVTGGSGGGGCCGGPEGNGDGDSGGGLGGDGGASPSAHVPHSSTASIWNSRPVEAVRTTICDTGTVMGGSSSSSHDPHAVPSTPDHACTLPLEASCSSLDARSLPLSLCQ
eukprot:3597535-Prymnesium_polylepis.1